MKYAIAHHTLRGTRSSNQDRVGYAERDNAVLLVLGDGLGGHAGGALAAEILVRVAIEDFRAVRQPVIREPFAFLALTIMRAHRAMHTVGARKSPPIQPRTTCVVCLVQDGYAYWAHVGDSRLYHYRNGKLLKRTRDDSSVEKLRREGLLTEEEMLTHPGKSVLLRCLGASETPEITFGEEVALHRNDVLLMCSDGLWEAFAPDEMLKYLQQGPIEERLEQMLHDGEDRKARGSDNITAIALRWEDGVTHAPRLQRDGAHIDSKLLLAGTGPASGARKQPTPRPERPAEPSLDESLRELDDLLKRLTKT